MNRIVKRHYPAAKLPADLREGLDPGAEGVTVTVEAEPVRAPSFAAAFRRLEALRRGADDPVARVRAVRDEWDEREREIEALRTGMRRP